jgi:hypothetical protein
VVALTLPTYYANSGLRIRRKRSSRQHGWKELHPTGNHRESRGNLSCTVIRTSIYWCEVIHAAYITKLAPPKAHQLGFGIANRHVQAMHRDYSRVNNAPLSPTGITLSIAEKKGASARNIEWGILAHLYIRIYIYEVLVRNSLCTIAPAVNDMSLPGDLLPGIFS